MSAYSKEGRIEISKDSLRLESSTAWIYDLAKAEVHPEAEKLLQLTKAFDPNQLVEESAILFLAELKNLLSEYARIFNQSSESGQKYSEIKIYQLAQTAADFMMFRNQVKLVISNSAHGLIQVTFVHHQRQPMTVDGQGHVQATAQGMAAADSPQTADFLAVLGPFRDVHWTFQGEKVLPDQVAKYYFSEFVRATRDTRRSRAGNQLLLEQIKALLNEKGLDL